MKLARRLSEVGESATMRVTRRVAELEAQGTRIVSFGAGEPDFPSPTVAVEAARQALADGFTRYTPAAGLLDLRHALLKKFERTWGSPWRQPGEIAITVGAKAALFELALALFDDGDEVVIPSPCWVTFPEQVKLAGAVPVLVASSFSNAFSVDVDELLSAFSARTKAVILNSPCNPTGAVMGRADLERLVEACAGRGVLLIADETYERFVYEDSAFVSAAAWASDHPGTVVVVGSFSKTYAMTGWRVGYVLGPLSVVSAVASIQSHVTSNPTSFAMKGAEAALRLAEPDVVRMIEEFGKRRDLMVAALEAMPGVRCVRPAGAFYVFPWVRDCYHAGEGSVEFAEYLLEEAAVAVVPGQAFGEDHHVRLSFTSPRDALEEGLRAMSRAIRARS